MKTQQSVVQFASEDQASTLSKPYLPVGYDEPAIDVESVVTGVVMLGMLGFLCMMFIGCFDAGLIA